jgi:hypothetical protein
MSSAATRFQIVTDALALAGRGNELRQSANGWLNYSLRDVGLTFRFPELRKFGVLQTLATGANTAPVPSDFVGMDKSGMIFGPDKKPLNEVSFEEFANNRGFPIPNQTGRPYRYMVDQEAGLFRFDNVADQAYTFQPCYFMTPPEVPVNSTGDTMNLWIDNDLIAVHALVWWIYTFTNDEREQIQEQRLERLLTKWKRETVKLGGTSRVMPSPQRFKNTTYVGFGGFNGP